MISLHGPHGPIDGAGLRSGAPAPEGLVWIDLHDPTAEEARLVEEATGIRVPSRAALSEVESSSRLRRLKAGGLSLSSPMIAFDRPEPSLTPLGFVITREHLLTVRFSHLRAYDTVKRRVAERDGDCATGLEVFLLVVEELVDNLADILEEMSGDLGRLSTRIFDFDPGAEGTPASTRAEARDARRAEARSPKRRDLALRRLLRAIGRQGKSLSKVRASLLGLERIVPFVKESCPQALGLAQCSERASRFDVLSRDIASLDEFETRQSETLQFLLDATLGLINIEQNNTFRILTVVSAVGVPPTLIASIYGMNFKHMPELDWTYGYPYGLALLLASALIPIAVFRIRGWL